MMSKQYQCRPSSIMAIEDEYDAFCFDEACAYFLSELGAEKQPHFPEDEKANPTLNKLITGLL